MVTALSWKEVSEGGFYIYFNVKSVVLLIIIVTTKAHTKKSKKGGEVILRVSHLLFWQFFLFYSQ